MELSPEIKRQPIPCVGGVGDPVAKPWPPSYFLIHGSVLWTAWCLFGMIQIISNRYLKHFWRYRLNIHIVSGLFILIVTLWYGFFGLYKMGGTIKDDAHAKLGITVTSIVSLVIVSGALAIYRLRDSTENQRLMTFYKYLHKYFAYCFIVLGEITVYFGIYYYNFNKCWKTNLHWIHVLVFCLPLVALECVHQFHWLKEKILLQPDQTVPDWTPERFIEASEQNKKERILVILDEWVVDTTEFVDQHPGGAFMLKRMNGKDISKYFHGGYNLEPTRNGWSNAHSNYARKIVKSLIVAKLVQGENKTYSALFKVKEKTSVNDKTATFIMEKDDEKEFEYKNFYTDLGMVGRHFLVQQENDKGQLVGEARTYTVANSMIPEQYISYVECLEQHILDNVTYKLYEHVEETDVTIPLTVKDYSDGKYLKRLSHQIHDNKGKKFRIKGPLGKGLGIPRGADGYYIAFAAGTGVLVFMDLVAHLARRALNQLQREEEGMLGQNFKFIFFVSFPSRHDAIGLDMLEKLNKLVKKSDKANQFFELKLRLTNEEAEFNGRWDTAFLDATLSEYWEIQSKSDEKHALKKIWACGPPAMNFEFEERMRRWDFKDLPWANKLEIL